jgi:DNA-directed RNA polymerase specialized sigma24 family protein
VNKHQEQFFLYRIRLFKDEKAFAHLYKEYHSAIWRFLSIKLPTSEVEDALSMVFIRLWNYLSGSRVENVSGLSFTIARGVVADL